MTDKPILMSAAMVRATLREIENPGAGKTQTRPKILGKDPDDDSDVWQWKNWIGNGQSERAAKTWSGDCAMAQDCPYGQSGDLLWVRETHRVVYRNSAAPQADIIHYKASATPEILREDKWTPSIHMPRWASRITLEITDIRVERLQDISAGDCIAEGLDVETIGAHKFYNGIGGEPVAAFRKLWDGINEKRGFGWDANPFVWAITFRPHLCNIDHFRDAAKMVGAGAI